MMLMDQRDLDWLGDGEAHLAPAARAALGILLEIDDWAWWRDPSKALSSLRKAVPPHSPVKWGGDSSLMDADQWIDPQRGIMLGEAFHRLLRERSLKIKIVRSVWAWPEGRKAIDLALSEMSNLVGAGYVFPEWEHNVKPRFPIVSKPKRGVAVVTAAPDLLTYGFLSDVRERLEWGGNSDVVEIVVADSIESIRRIRAARLVVLYGKGTEAISAHISHLREELLAQCVVHVDVDDIRIVDWLQSTISALIEQKVHFADAIKLVQEESGWRTLVLSSTQSFLFARHSLFDGPTTVERRISSVDYPSRIEQSLPSRIGDVSPSDFSSHSSGRAGAHRRSAPPSTQELSRELIKPRGRVRPGPPVERILNARARRGRHELQIWPIEGSVDIDIDIRVKSPLRDGQRDDRPLFPDDRVEWAENSKLLQVHLLEFGCDPESRVLELSRTGNSTTATFTRYGGMGSVDLRFLISDGAQILQTARLQSAPGESIHFFIENIVTPVDRTKASFDVALLVNDSLGKQPSVTIISDTGDAIFYPLSETDTATAREHLLQVLEEAISNPHAALAPLMLKLANKGALLQSNLRSLVHNWPSSEGRIQLVTQSDAFFPIEYLYDGQMPDSPDAQLCTECVGCLNKGKAISNCNIREAGEQLCPMGFLGVSGVIERHLWKSGQEVRPWSTFDEPTPKRYRIDDLSSIAFAASDKADRFRDSEVEPHEVVRIANIESSLGVKRVPDWSSWKANLTQGSPSLLLWLLHLDNDVAFVGANSGLNLSAIGKPHVREAPVVIAIGCSSGLRNMPGGSLPVVLQRSGVRIVVAAMTKILGRHANRVARDLALFLREAASKPNSSTVGEIISAMRRRLLADGLALGLAIVAFGDADIVLGKE